MRVLDLRALDDAAVVVVLLDFAEADVAVYLVQFVCKQMCVALWKDLRKENEPLEGSLHPDTAPGDIVFFESNAFRADYCVEKYLGLFPCAPKAHQDGEELQIEDIDAKLYNLEVTILIFDDEGTRRLVKVHLIILMHHMSVNGQVLVDVAVAQIRFS